MAGRVVFVCEFVRCCGRRSIVETKQNRRRNRNEEIKILNHVFRTKQNLSGEETSQPKKCICLGSVQNEIMVSIAEQKCL